GGGKENSHGFPPVARSKYGTPVFLGRGGRGGRNIVENGRARNPSRGGNCAISPQSARNQPEPLCRAFRLPPAEPALFGDEAGHVFDSLTGAKVGEHERPRAAHAFR